MSKKVIMPTQCKFIYFVITTTFLYVLTQSQWGSSGAFCGGRIELIFAPYYPSDPPIFFNFNYGWTLYSMPSSVGLGIITMQTPVTYDLHFNISAANPTTIGFHLTFQSFGDTIFTYLIAYYGVYVPSLQYVQTIQTCHICSIVNSGSGTRTQNFAGSTKFLAKTLVSLVFLTGISLRNTVGLVNAMDLQSNIPQWTSSIQYSLTVYQNNTLQNICFSTLIYNQISTKQYNIYHQAYGVAQLSQSILPNIGFVNKNYARYGNPVRTYFGMSGFNMSRTISRHFVMPLRYIDDFDQQYDTNAGLYKMKISYFFTVLTNCNFANDQYFDVPTQTCVANTSCTPGTTKNLIGNIYQFCNYCNYTCDTCDGSSLKNCTSCSAQNFRPVLFPDNTCPCNTGYIDIGIARCQPCDQFIPGCRNCISISICTQCDNGFVLNAINTCECTSGFLVTGICINITGCISAVSYSGTIYCLACNQTANFKRTSYSFTCQCNPGFTFTTNVLNGIQQCLFTCGDGILVSGQQCDDGNLIDNDGCSSLCKIETNYSCTSNLNDFPASVCKIITRPSLSLLYIERNPYLNSMKMVLKINPQYQEFSSMQFNSLILHNIPSTQDTLVSYSHSSGQITLQIFYSETLQGNYYQILLNLDKDYFDISSIQLNFKAYAMNAKLTYDSNDIISSNYAFQLVFIIISIAALIVLISSLWIESLIGIQLIQTYQSVFFILAIFTTLPNSLYPFKSLKYSNGYNIISGLDPYRIYNENFHEGKISWQQQFLLNFNIMFVLIILIIIVVLILKLISLKYEQKIQKNKSKNKTQFKQNFQKFKNIRKKYQFIIQRILFISVLLCEFSIVFSFSTELSTSSANYQIINNKINIGFSMLAIGIVIFTNTLVMMSWKFPTLKTFKFNKINKLYPSLYIAYQFLFITLISIFNQYGALTYILFIMIISFMILILILNPYSGKLHNIGLIINQTIIILALGIVQISKYQTQQKQQQFSQLYRVLFYIEMILMILIVPLTTYRLYRWYTDVSSHFTQKKLKDEEDQYKQKEQYEKEFEADNQKMIMKKQFDFDKSLNRQKSMNQQKNKKSNDEITQFQEKYLEQMETYRNMKKTKKVQIYQQNNKNKINKSNQNSFEDEDVLKKIKAKLRQNYQKVQKSYQNQ